MKTIQNKQMHKLKPKEKPELRMELVKKNYYKELLFKNLFAFNKLVLIKMIKYIKELKQIKMIKQKHQYIFKLLKNEVL
jgi:hypothetical protein